MLVGRGAIIVKRIRKGGRKTLANDDDCGDGVGPPSRETRAEKRLRGYTEGAEISLPRSGFLEPPDAMDSR
jgi:hypothetical protein